MKKKTVKKIKRYRGDVLRSLPLVSLPFAVAGEIISSFTSCLDQDQDDEGDVGVYSEDDRVLSIVSAAYTATALGIVEVVGRHKQPMLQTRESMLGVSMMFHCGDFHGKRTDQIIWTILRYLFERCAIDFDKYSENVFISAMEHFKKIKK